MESQVNQTSVLDGHAVRAAINPHLQSVLRINREHSVATRSAKSLLSAARFDVVAKYVYAHQRLLGLESAWGQQVYREHLRVWNDFREGDNSGKSGYDAFIQSFDKVIDSIHRDGFNDSEGLIPVGAGDVIIDGAHRVAAALAADRTVRTVHFDVEPSRYDYSYFRQRLLSPLILDDIALHYCRLDSSVRVAVLFPVATGRSEDVSALLQQIGPIFYEKLVEFGTIGHANLIRVLYKNEPWVGDGVQITDGLRRQVQNRFRGQEPVRFIFFSGANSETARAVKSEIRGLFAIGNDSIHICDTHSQAMAIAESVLNSNSVHFLNHARPASFTNFNALFRRTKEWLQKGRINKELFCIDGSSVLSAYGVREAADVDFLFLGEEPDTPDPLISCHNGESHHYGSPLEDLVMDPRNHFIHDGIKFLAVHVLEEMKQHRAEPKDLRDVQLIQMLSDQVSARARLLRTYYAASESYHRSRQKSLSAAKKLIPRRLLPFARTLYHMPRRLKEFRGPVRRTIIYRGYELHYSRGTSLLESFDTEKIYESAVSRRLIDTLRQSSSPFYVDIGANIGLVTLNVLAEVPETNVVAFEPGPHQASLLAQTLAANALTDRVALINSALGREEGVAQFAVHKSRHASGDGFYDTHRAGGTKTIDVNVTTLDSWWASAGSPRIDAMKIDTEGAELWVMQGGTQLIRTCRPFIVFELHPKNLSVYPYSALDVFRFLADHGYKIATLQGDPVLEQTLDLQMKSCNDYVASHGSK